MTMLGDRGFLTGVEFGPDESHTRLQNRAWRSYVMLKIVVNVIHFTLPAWALGHLLVAWWTPMFRIS